MCNRRPFALGREKKTEMKEKVEANRWPNILLIDFFLLFLGALRPRTFQAPTSCIAFVTGSNFRAAGHLGTLPCAR